MSPKEKDLHQGYRGPTLELLKRFGITVWCEVRAKTTRGEFVGLVLPRSETSDDLHLVLKLSIGYNIGVRHDTILELEKIGFREAHYQIPEKEFPTDPAHPSVKLLGTGGTIASRLDYRTGAVIPAFSPGELYGSVPELADICNLETEKLFGVFSENMGPEQYLILAEKTGEAIQEGYEGIVIGHGTDTMHHTAAALSFMVQKPPVPIVMVVRPLQPPAQGDAGEEDALLGSEHVPDPGRHSCRDGGEGEGHALQGGLAPEERRPGGGRSGRLR
jgi:glutamyl-tRNA(Gln) amidotransferase subunit D